MGHRSWLIEIKNTNQLSIVKNFIDICQSEYTCEIVGAVKIPTEESFQTWLCVDSDGSSFANYFMSNFKFPIALLGEGLYKENSNQVEYLDWCDPGFLRDNDCYIEIDKIENFLKENPGIQNEINLEGMFNKEFLADLAEMADLHILCEQNIYYPNKTVDSLGCKRFKELMNKRLPELEQIVKLILPTGMITVDLKLNILKKIYKDYSSVLLHCTDYVWNSPFILSPSSFVDGKKNKPAKKTP
jgi:hypothetical protein